jgi:hypothetical protein
MLFKVRETVATDTPAAFATSLIVARALMTFLLHHYREHRKMVVRDLQDSAPL